MASFNEQDEQNEFDFFMENIIFEQTNSIIQQNIELQQPERRKFFKKFDLVEYHKPKTAAQLDELKRQAMRVKTASEQFLKKFPIEQYGREALEKRQQQQQQQIEEKTDAKIFDDELDIKYDKNNNKNTEQAVDKAIAAENMDTLISIEEFNDDLGDFDATNKQTNEVTELYDSLYGQFADAAEVQPQPNEAELSDLIKFDLEKSAIDNDKKTENVQQQQSEQKQSPTQEIDQLSQLLSSKSTSDVATGQLNASCLADKKEAGTIDFEKFKILRGDNKKMQNARLRQMFSSATCLAPSQQQQQQQFQRPQITMSQTSLNSYLNSPSPRPINFMPPTHKPPLLAQPVPSQQQQFFVNSNVDPFSQQSPNVYNYNISLGRSYRPPSNVNSTRDPFRQHNPNTATTTTSIARPFMPPSHYIQQSATTTYNLHLQDFFRNPNNNNNNNNNYAQTNITTSTAGGYRNLQPIFQSTPHPHGQQDGQFKF